LLADNCQQECLSGVFPILATEKILRASFTRAADARAYNELITSWSPIESAAAATPSTAPAQKTLFE
jgi:hypothetical protein